MIIGTNNWDQQKEARKKELAEQNSLKTRTKCYGCAKFRLKTDPVWRKCSHCIVRCCNSNKCFDILKLHQDLHVEIDRENEGSEEEI